MSTTRHALIVTIAVVVLSVALILFFVNVPVVPTAAATQAIPVDNLFVLMFSIASVFFAIVVVVMLYSVIVFRSRPGDEEDGPGLRGINWLEITWSIIPLIIVMVLAVYGALALGSMVSPQPQEMEVKVVSAQWSWQYEYPQYDITSSELHLPVNQPVLLKLNALDVVHSFWVPEFRVKQDAVPGIETVLRITPVLEGEYTVLCAELCGLLHAYMTGPVVVTSQAEFDEWIEEQQDSD